MPGRPPLFGRYAPSSLRPSQHRNSSRLRIYRRSGALTLENQADAEDLFTAKLKSYRSEFDAILAQARAATDDADGHPLSVLSITLERA
jgi:hypothetical protein